MPNYPRKRSREHCEAISRGVARRYEDPAEREKTAAATQKYWDGNDAALKRRAELTASYWLRPGYRENQIEKMQGRVRDNSRLDDRDGSVYIAYNSSRDDGNAAYKVGSVKAGREDRRLYELRKGYRRWAKDGDDVAFLELFPCWWFRQVERRAHEMLGMDEAHIRSCGEITTEPFNVIRKAVLRAVEEVDGFRIADYES